MNSVLFVAFFCYLRFIVNAIQYVAHIVRYHHINLSVILGKYPEKRIKKIVDTLPRPGGNIYRVAIDIVFRNTFPWQKIAFVVNVQSRYTLHIKIFKRVFRDPLMHPVMRVRCIHYNKQYVRILNLRKCGAESFDKIVRDVFDKSYGIR